MVACKQKDAIGHLESLLLLIFVVNEQICFYETHMFLNTKTIVKKSITCGFHHTIEK